MFRHIHTKVGQIFCFEAVFLSGVSVGPGCQDRVEGGRLRSEPDFIYFLIYVFSAAGGRIMWSDLDI